LIEGNYAENCGDKSFLHILVTYLKSSELYKVHQNIFSWIMY